MRCFKLLPLALCGLALAAQPDTDILAAILRGHYPSKLIVYRGRCVNLKKTQPTFFEIDIEDYTTCTLFSDLECSGRPVGDGPLESGIHDIGDVRFKSVHCEAVNGIATEAQL